MIVLHVSSFFRSRELIVTGSILQASKTELDEIKEIFGRVYPELLRIFTYYCAISSTIGNGEFRLLT